MERLKKWLERVLFPEQYFMVLRGNKENSTFSFVSVLLFALLMCLWAFNFTFRTGLPVWGWVGLVAICFGAFTFTHNQKQMAQLLTFPLAPRDYALGRFILSLPFGLGSLLGTTLGFVLERNYLSLAWGLVETLPFSQILAFGLASFSVYIFCFGLATLLRTRLSQVGFMWIFIPLAGGLSLLLILDPEWALTRHFWLEHLTIPVALAVLALTLGLTFGMYHWAAKALSRWEIPKKVPVRKKILRTAAVLVVLALVAGLVWKSNRYVSPVDESLSPEEQYQVAVQCQEEGDIYGAAVSFYACGDHADARERCWEMWGKIVPRSTVALTGRQVVALTEDGGILVSIPPDAEPYFTADEIDVSRELVSIHGGSSFLVGLYADGTVGLFGEYPEEWREIIAGWHDIVELYVGKGYFDGYIAGLRSDGTPVLCFGNSGDKLEDDERDRLLDQTNLRAMGAGLGQMAALHADGSVTAYDDVGVTHGVALWSDVVAVNAGFGCTFGLRADGTVYSGGDNSWGQCNVQQWSDIVAIDAEYFCTAGLRRDGTVLVTGDLVGKSDLDQTAVAQWREIADVILSGNLLVGLRTDGTLVATGDTELIQEALDDWENIRLPR